MRGAMEAITARKKVGSKGLVGDVDDTIQPVEKQERAPEGRCCGVLCSFGDICGIVFVSWLVCTKGWTMKEKDTIPSICFSQRSGSDEGGSERMREREPYYIAGGSWRLLPSAVAYYYSVSPKVCEANRLLLLSLHSCSCLS